MSHRAHRPIRLEEQVYVIVLRELQESSQFFPSPLFGTQRALACHPFVEKTVDCSLLLLCRQVGWGSYANIGKQTLNENVVGEGVGEEDRVVNHRVVEGVTIWLILEKSCPFDAENLQPNSDDGSQNPV